MTQPRPWLDEVLDAFEELGGEATLKEIYDRIESRGIMNFYSNKHWQAAVRRTIETHSSDSEAYKEEYPDLFESTAGIGKGIWNLR
ncbi:hypothetical protein FYZ48_00225 [Gimesia chilikensis]|uniref:hypothetical protein n=1 Tax=Gimesia chilikensis TaxID=2605989 RepID=UPI0011ECF632|nr:hypothetical protein [Gimesia chilikensis]KAA0142852.1 hypothetical protein FYZ48_00225 [Gimesia chilikensis]